MSRKDSSCLQRSCDAFDYVFVQEKMTTNPLLLVCFLALQPEVLLLTTDREQVRTSDQLLPLRRSGMSDVEGQPTPRGEFDFRSRRRATGSSRHSAPSVTGGRPPRQHGQTKADESIARERQSSSADVPAGGRPPALPTSTISLMQREHQFPDSADDDTTYSTTRDLSKDISSKAKAKAPSSASPTGGAPAPAPKSGASAGAPTTSSGGSPASRTSPSSGDPPGASGTTSPGAPSSGAPPASGTTSAGAPSPGGPSPVTGTSAGAPSPGGPPVTGTSPGAPSPGGTASGASPGAPSSGEPASRTSSGAPTRTTGQAPRATDTNGEERTDTTEGHESSGTSGDADEPGDGDSDDSGQTRAQIRTLRSPDRGGGGASSRGQPMKQPEQYVSSGDVTKPGNNGHEYVTSDRSAKQYLKNYPHKVDSSLGAKGSQIMLARHSIPGVSAAAGDITRPESRSKRKLDDSTSQQNEVLSTGDVVLLDGDRRKPDAKRLPAATNASAQPHEGDTGNAALRNLEDSERTFDASATGRKQGSVLCEDPADIDTRNMELWKARQAQENMLYLDKKHSGGAVDEEVNNDMQSTMLVERVMNAVSQILTSDPQIALQDISIVGVTSSGHVMLSVLDDEQEISGASPFRTVQVDQTGLEEPWFPMSQEDEVRAIHASFKVGLIQGFLTLLMFLGLIFLLFCICAPRNELKPYEESLRKKIKLILDGKWVGPKGGGFQHETHYYSDGLRPWKEPLIYTNHTMILEKLMKSQEESEQAELVEARDRAMLCEQLNDENILTAEEAAHLEAEREYLDHQHELLTGEKRYPPGMVYEEANSEDMDDGLFHGGEDNANAEATREIDLGAAAEGNDQKTKQVEKVLESQQMADVDDGMDALARKEGTMEDDAPAVKNRKTTGKPKVPKVRVVRPPNKDSR